MAAGMTMKNNSIHENPAFRRSGRDYVRRGFSGHCEPQRQRLHGYVIYLTREVCH